MFTSWDLDEEARSYVAYHARRYALLLDSVDRARRDLAAPPDGAGLRLVDVGPLFQTHLLRRSYPAARVDTAGFAHALFQPGEGERHIEVDLNEAGEPGRCPAAPGHDIVVMGEVIEHLHTAPGAVLECVRTWLRPGGRVLLQTPNAIALHKRLRLLAGRNVLEPIRRSRINPGHFHEYTIGELRDAAAEAGLTDVFHETGNYFDPPGSRSARAYAALGKALPPSFRHGITICLATPDRL